METTIYDVGVFTRDRNKALALIDDMYDEYKYMKPNYHKEDTVITLWIEENNQAVRVSWVSPVRTVLNYQCDEIYIDKRIKKEPDGVKIIDEVLLPKCINLDDEHVVFW